MCRGRGCKGTLCIPSQFCCKPKTALKKVCFFKQVFSFKKTYIGCTGLRSCEPVFSSCGEWRLLFVTLLDLIFAVSSPVAEHRLQAQGLQQLQHVSSRVKAQQLWHTGLVAPGHVESSLTRDRTCVPCISKQTLIHCTSGKSLKNCLKKKIQKEKKVTGG